MPELQPFQNESETLQIGELTIENRIDQLELYGSLAITRDQAGLQQALRLKALLDEVVVHLQNEKDLPEQVFFRASENVDNPFKN
ncbi:MAG: hypothetical protein RL618_2176 [Pseudomonadota bacterium]